MSRLANLGLLLLGPAAAQAHPGGHLHPHGADLPLALLLATAAWLLVRGRP